MVEVPAHVYVSLERDQDGYPPFDSEELDAVELGADQYRIVGAPAFVYGLAPGDVVRAERPRGDDRRWVVEVLRSSANWLARVVPRGGMEAQAIMESFRLLGCDARVTPYGVVTVVVPPTADKVAVLARLQDGQERTSSWHFDLGVAPEA